MHILFLSDNFPPEVNAPASRTFEHCRVWVKAGHAVTVVTGAPNFPVGRVFAGYRNRLWQREVVDGVHVIRVWTYITPNEGIVRRTVDYLSFMLAGFLAGLCVRRVDVVVGTSPQFFTVCAAYLLSVFKRVPWVFELRDIWPDSIRAVGAIKGRLVLRLLESVEMFLYRKASAIVSVTHSFRSSLVGRGIDGEKIAVVTNGVDVARFAPMEKDSALMHRYGLEGKFVAGYIGTHGMAHSLGTILEAAKLLQQTPCDDRFRFLLLGDGAQREYLKRRAETDGLHNVVFIDSVPKDQVAIYWSLLDVSIVHLKNDPLFRAVIPSKIFESMGMAIPVLHGVLGESADIVEREDVGLVFEPEDPAALALALRRLAEDANLFRRLREHGPVAARRYDRDRLAMSMLSAIEGAVNGKAVASRIDP